MWRRGKTLGQGAFGKVSLAEVITEEGSGFPTDMAVKSAAVSECRSLRHELRAFRDIQPCPHVIRCFGYNITMEQGVLLYNIFLEFATGGSLADLLHRYGGGLPVNEVRKYTRSVLMGLRHIHRQGYVHCDIKPGNLLLLKSDSSVSPFSCSLSLNKRKRVEEYTAKIADFGLAMKVGKRKTNRGSLPYIAPESVLHGHYGTEADIWALGCSVLQLLTGKLPWNFEQDNERAALLFKIGFTDKIPEIPCDLSMKARDFLGNCLIRDPKSRWTADMLLDHPFITGSIRVRGGRKRVFLPEATRAAMGLSPKAPTLISNSDLIEKKDTCIIPDCRKRSKIMEEDAQKEKPNADVALDMLRRYWCVESEAIETNSDTHIEIFN
ncbi:Mitogen-activated protein kinase kinase kinase [Bertholletia excelsa]